MKVGDTIYVFDENHRVYPRNGDGRSTGSPIYREHFRPTIIESETSQSWVLGGRFSGWKVSKKDLNVATFRGGFRNRVCLSTNAVESEVYVHDNGYQISRIVELCKDYAKLKRIAEIIGFVPASPNREG